MKKFLLVPCILAFTLTACSPSPKDKILKVQEYTQIMKTGKDLVDPVHGKEVKFYYGAISGTDGTEANGLGYIHVFEDGTSSVTVNVNIELPATGTTYIAYIEDSTGGTSVKVGALKSIVKDVRHTVKLFTTLDVSKTLNVKIRREGKGKNILVAQGTMKTPSPAQ